MKKITRQILANSAASRFNLTYGSGVHDGVHPHSEKVPKLLALGPVPDADKVDEIIGNKSWTAVCKCDECNKHSDIVIRLGEEPDYESATAYVCAECLARAIDLCKGGTQ